MLESPSIPHLINTATGICRGREEIRTLLQKAAPGNRSNGLSIAPAILLMAYCLVCEYPRRTPDGVPMDFLEVIEVDNGLIQYHRVYYWGWAGVEVIRANAYHKKND